LRNRKKTKWLEREKRKERYTRKKKKNASANVHLSRRLIKTRGIKEREPDY